MSKLGCPCGNLISNCASPNEVEGYLFTDMDVEMDKLDPYRDARSIWECDECGRLAVSFPTRRDNRVKWYSPDDKIPGRLMELEHHPESES